jgi:hypothetical protein
VSTGHPASSREAALLVAAFLGLVAASAWLAGSHLDAPGLFYDEVIQAEPAVQFLLPDGRPVEAPGFTSVRFLGGWFPVMTQPYMGALKSQLLIPVFASFAATAETLRWTTLIWAWVGLALAMAWTRAVAGTGPALLAGALLAFDPSFLLVSRHDWGSSALGLVFRCGALVLATSGWRRRSSLRLLAAGVLVGLGLFNKIDFAIFGAAAALGLLAACPGTLWTALRREPRRLLPAGAGLAIGAAPLIAGLADAWSATRTLFERQGGAATDWDAKLHTLVSMLDGSYFHRMMLAGGDFDRMAQMDAAASNPFGWIFVGSAVFLAARALGRPEPKARVCRERTDADRVRIFVLVTAVLSGVGFLLTPGAERIHHAMNGYPFAEITVALAAVDLWRAAPRLLALRALAHGAAAAVATAALAGNLLVTTYTLATIQVTGGKGRWSNALARFGEELETEPGVVVVSLDWGLHGPLRFSSRELVTVEPIWKMSRPGMRAGMPWVHEGTPETVYLLYPDEFALFDFGAQLLAEIETLPPGSATVRQHVDGTGDVAFLSVRFARPHRLTYDRELEVRLR